MKAVIRTLAVVYLLTTYVLALVFSGLGREGNRLWLTVAVAGLVFYVMGAIVLQMIQHRENRPVWILAALIGYPFLTFYLQFGMTGILTREFWRYAGWTDFLMVGGGFVLGIVMAPLIAHWRGIEDDQIAMAVRRGREHIARYGWKGLGGVSALVALLVSPLVLGVRMAMEQAEALRAGQGWPYVAYTVAGILVMMGFTYGQTLFGLQEKRGERIGLP